MFKEGDIIRRRTEDGTGEIVRVLETPEYESESVYVATGNDDSDSYIDPSDYELVTDNQTVQEAVPQTPNVSSKTQEDIHDDISKMFVQATQFLQSNLDGETIELEITGETSSDSIDVSFKVRIRYEAWVVSSNLFTAAQVALARYKENKGLKPLSIPLYRNAAE